MIPVKSTSTTEVGPGHTHVPGKGQPWRRELLEAVTDVGQLLRLVDVDPSDVRTVMGEREGLAPHGAVRDFPLRVPRPYIARMRRGDPNDPLLRQVLPTTFETERLPGYGIDPLDEADAVVTSGVLKKYEGRALIIATGACAVHCRYCFRRHFPYAEHRQDSSFQSIAAVRGDPSIREVILSGGDPLMLTDAHLARLLAEVGSIDHVTRIRIHTRVPVVIPGCVTPALTAMLADLPQRVVVVLHFNHPNELDRDCATSLAGLDRFTLLNQSVLLRGVNDDAHTLVELSERLFDAGVLPYYLHMPDAVAGTAHFDVPQRRAVALHRHLQARLPGYLVPRLVREVPARHREGTRRRRRARANAAPSKVMRRFLKANAITLAAVGGYAIAVAVVFVGVGILNAERGTSTMSATATPWPRTLPMTPSTRCCAGTAFSWVC